MENSKGFKEKIYSNKVIDLISAEINNFESDSINLSDNVTFSQYLTVQRILTHQNKGFLTQLAPGQVDDREAYDIISPMVETAVVNIDLDAENLDAYVDNSDYIAHEYFAKSILKNYLKQTNHGIVINEIEYQFIDDGNLVVRRVNDNGELYRPVLPQNLYVIDQAAKNLEQTTVIEKDVMNQTEVRQQKVWDNIEAVNDLCNIGEDLIPYYEIYYRYGELSVKTLRNVMKEVHGKGYSYNKGDNEKYVQSLVIMAKPKTGTKDADNKDIKGVIVFAEELKPQKFKITAKLEITRYKPYEFVRLGKFNGRFWGLGYREIGIPYQNRANELGNQIRYIMKIAGKLVFWSSDKKIAGKNILSSLKNGQIIKAENLQLLNNVYPNLSLFAEEWNRNIRECEKALKAFEVASGESLPSSTSATAIGIQNMAVGKYYNFKRERLGLFLGTVWKRWVLPDILKNTTPEEAFKIMGDPNFIEQIVEAYCKGWFAENVLKTVAIAGGIVTREQSKQILAMKKQELLKQPQLYGKITKDFFKDVEMFVAINATGELFNKQAAISNILKLLEYETNPNIMQNPEALNTINELKEMLGLKPTFRTAILTQSFQQPSGKQPIRSAKLPEKEQSVQESVQNNSEVVY